MKPRTSPIWMYFIPVDQNQAKCKICEKLYSRKGRSTSPLKGHLRSMHPQHFQQFASIVDLKFAAVNPIQVQFVRVENIAPKVETVETVPSTSEMNETFDDFLDDDDDDPDFPKTKPLPRPSLTNSQTHQNIKSETQESVSLKRKMEDDIQPAKRPREGESSLIVTQDDECDLFGKFIAEKLRNLPEGRKDELMFKIHTLVYEESSSAATGAQETTVAQNFRMPSPVCTLEEGDQFDDSSSNVANICKVETKSESSDEDVYD